MSGDIEINIDQIVVTGISCMNKKILRETIQQELVRLLNANTVPPVSADINVPSLTASTFNHFPGMSDKAIGTEVAKAVHKTVSRE